MFHKVLTNILYVKEILRATIGKRNLTKSTVVKRRAISISSIIRRHRLRDEKRVLARNRELNWSDSVIKKLCVNCAFIDYYLTAIS